MDNREQKRSLHELIKKLLEADSEEQQIQIFAEIDKISPDPNHIDYIFQSDEFTDENGALDIGAVVEKIFSYKPIIL